MMFVKKKKKLSLTKYTTVRTHMPIAYLIMTF